MLSNCLLFTSAPKDAKTVEKLVNNDFETNMYFSNYIF